ncbi:MAG: four helix bundle protein [Acidobacteriota bacterium]
MDLAEAVYLATRSFPKEETFGLSSQVRRAVISIPANIAEGAARHGTKEYLQFLSIARGSLAELQTLLELAQRIGFLSSSQAGSLNPLVKEVSALLGGLIASLRRRTSISPKP